ncbi:uncharacterized protein N7506_011359 [Penicillium brevicompactum]|uniref:uncharacterized protein n=1 Tax=Penicillium brevicompactum TaxID=5074 RepID=UPI00253FD79F|nr:uncharacterized protein N7506_011359 [Penicillium brevicompactum]KAJ5322229.1 hypothetical protein N7506_011359 [Penicillium brevicompactum]
MDRFYNLLFPKAEPAEPPAMAINDESRKEVRKRTPIPLSFELMRQTEIFIEETLYPQAFTLLLDALSSGNVSSASGTVASTPVVMPQPQHLAIAATMLVHPFTTTRARLDAEKEAPNIALRLLRLTNALVGPTAAQFHTAFAFTHFETSRNGKLRADSPALNGTMCEDKRTGWEASYSGGRSVWNEAEDFWHAVGWALNCSVLHQAQWRHWHLWLQFMCQVLEDDWEDRAAKYTQAQEELLQRSHEQAPSGVEPAEQGIHKKSGRPRKGDVKQDDGLEIYRQSLIFQYITSNDTFGRDRRIMRSIFADGTPRSAEFRAVFEDEIKTPRDKSSSNKKKRVGVDLSKGEYGDYQNDSHEDYASSGKESSRPVAMAPGRQLRQTKRSRRARNTKGGATDSDAELTDTAVDHNNGIGSLGGYNSLALRQRLLGLLFKVSATLPKDFTPPNEISHMLAENIRDLPLPVFQHMVTPSNLPRLGPDEHCSLCQSLFRFMVESSARAPPPGNDLLTQSDLEKYYFPYKAASPSTASNAKISILLEAMMTLLHNEKMLSATPELKEAARVGVERRESACHSHSGSVEAAYLRESHFRIWLMIDFILP